MNDLFYQNHLSKFLNSGYYIRLISHTEKNVFGSKMLRPTHFQTEHLIYHYAKITDYSNTLKSMCCQRC